MKIWLALQNFNADILSVIFLTWKLLFIPKAP